MSSTPHISQEDLALYAMQALDPAENSAVQAHLDTCAECRAALAEILGETALVCASVDQAEPPAGAGDRFLGRMQSTPQGAAASPDARRAVPSPGSANTGSATPAGVTPASTGQGPRGQGSSIAWLGWIAAAAALVFAAYLGNHNFRLQRQLDQDRAQIAQLSAQTARLQELTEALTSPAAMQVTLTETRRPSPPVGHAMYLRDRGALVFVASNLHPIPASKTYELWLIPAGGKAPVPAGMFRPDAQGSASVVLPPLPQDVAAKAFGVTVEEAQGSSTPTLPIVMSGQ